MTTSRYPMIEKLGLKIIEASKLYEDSEGRAPSVQHVNACDIEALLAKAPRVYGRGYGNPHDNKWSARTDSYDTETAILLCIEPIDYGVTKEELEEVSRQAGANHYIRNIMQRLCEYGVKK